MLEFTKKLQNIPLGKQKTMGVVYKNSIQENSNEKNSKQKTKSMAYSHLPEVEICKASPPKYLIFFCYLIKVYLL